MDSYEQESEHRKKRRRREIAPTPTNARLTFDDSIKGDAAAVSPALWQLLYPDAYQGIQNLTESFLELN
jgi:hypothetical protein